MAVVGVTDAIEVFRLGLARLLTDAGYRVEEPGDVAEWSLHAPADALIFVIRDANQADLVRRVAHCAPELPILAVVSELTLTSCVDIICAGAIGVVPIEADGDRVLSSIGAAIAGLAVLPTDIATALAAPAAALRRW